MDPLVYLKEKIHQIYHLINKESTIGSKRSFLSGSNVQRVYIYTYIKVQDTRLYFKNVNISVH